MVAVAIQLKGAHTDTLSSVRDAGYRPQLCVCVSISICQGPTSSAQSLTSHTAKSFVPRLWFMTQSWRGAQHQCAITWKRGCVCACVYSFQHKPYHKPNYFLPSPLLRDCMFSNIRSSLQRAKQGGPGERGSTQHQCRSTEQAGGHTMQNKGAKTQLFQSNARSTNQWRVPEWWQDCRQTATLSGISKMSLFLAAAGLLLFFVIIWEGFINCTA